MTTDARDQQAGGERRAAHAGDGAADTALGDARAPRILASTADLGAAAAPGSRGAIWRLEEQERHLDANVIALPPGERIDAHASPEEDVLWHVLAGSGTLATDGAELELLPGAIVWLPRRSMRAVTPGPDGLRYLSVHRRKPGLQIGRAPA